MSTLADTSVWSLALRRDTPPDIPEVRRLAAALDAGETIIATGVVLQELLQGFSGPRNHEAIIRRFAALPFVMPDRQDHIEAATLRNRCRRSGWQIGTIDALLAQLCLRHDLAMLSTDRDFEGVATLCGLRIAR